MTVTPKIIRNAMRGHAIACEGIKNNWGQRQNPKNRQNIREWIQSAKGWESSALAWGKYAATMARLDRLDNQVHS